MNDAPDDLVQRSPQWFEARLGRITSSIVGKAFGRLKRSNERTKEAIDVMDTLCAEQITGEPARRVNALAWGVAHEDEARAAYAFLKNAEIKQVGFIPHPTIANAGCSPDSLVGADGALELKAPTSATHLRTLLADAVPEEHLPQLHWVLGCTGREWIDFVSYDPRFPPEMRLFVKRVERDDEEIKRLEAEAIAFLEELDGKLASLRERYP